MIRSLIKSVQSLMLIVPALFMLNACITIPPPSYKYSREVERAFETPTLLKNHTYYFIGRQVQPDAIIAIDNQFTMTSEVWSKIEVTQKILDDWAFQFKHYIGWWSCPYKGAQLLAPDGRQVGAGYSRWTFSVVKMEGPNEIVVYPPQAIGECRKYEIYDDF